MNLSQTLMRLRGPIARGSNQPLTGSSEVWAVSRFDQKDSTIEVFWSERNIPGAEITDDAGTRRYGTHAEPLFIRAFPHLLLEMGRPRAVELFISRSACADGSAEMSANGTQFPRGCGPKLIQLALGYSDIDFFIVHDVLYAGNPNRPSFSILTASKNSLASYTTGAPNLHSFSFRQYEPYLLA